MKKVNKFSASGRNWSVEACDDDPRIDINVRTKTLEKAEAYDLGQELMQIAVAMGYEVKPTQPTVRGQVD